MGPVRECSTYDANSNKRTEDVSNQDDTVKCQLEFESFFIINRQLFRNVIARAVAYANVEVEDALQEGLERIWAEWEHWPESNDDRLRYSLRTLQVSSIDTVRRQHGRYGNRPQNVPIDFSINSSRNEGSSMGLDMHTSVDPRKALSNVQTHERDDFRALDRNVIAEACKALKPMELKILLKVGLLGYSYHDVADSLEISIGKVAELYCEVRHILRRLIAHANSMGEITEQDLMQMQQLMRGNLLGRELRIALRHYEHCDSCKKLVSVSFKVG